MTNFKTKTLAISIVILLAISMSASIILMPTASAHTPPWTISTQAYVSTVPANLGVGQNVFIVMWTYMKMPSFSYKQYY